MAKREIVILSAAGVQLTEVIYQKSQRVFSRYAVTTLRGRRRRDFPSLRDARPAFDEEVVASKRVWGLDKISRRTRSVIGRPSSARVLEAESFDGQL